VAVTLAWRAPTVNTIGSDEGVIRVLGNLNGIHLLVLVLVILLLFGAPKLPALARSMGQSMRIFRKEVQTLNTEKAADASAVAESGEPGAGGATSAAAPIETVTPSKH